MAKAISRFFAELGFRLRNIQWSWGARRGNSILLRTWQDEYAGRERKVTVLREPAAHLLTESFGLDERIVHLKALWLGEAAGYTVIMEAKDKDVRPREIKGYRDDVVFAIDRLEARPDGGIVAVLGDMVSVAKLREHEQTHRTASADGPFPVEDAQRSGLSTDSYQQKLPAIRAWLIELCGQRSTVTYSDVMNKFGLTFYPLRNAMSRLGHDCRKAGKPIITALIVDKETGLCSDGLQAEFGVTDDVAERERCYKHWAVQVATDVAEASPQVDTGQEPNDDLEARAARFAQVEVRQDQRAFRRAVFLACAGRCVVSGCDIPEALDAAHLLGRDWRQGHNSAVDGVLLRKDLHALYDRGLLRIAEGRVALEPSVRSHYASFEGIAPNCLELAEGTPGGV